MRQQPVNPPHEHSFRYDVVSSAQLHALAHAPLPLGMRAGAPSRSFYRDLYLDSPDGALRRRGVTCRLRISADDRRTLTLAIAQNGGGRPGWYHARVRATDPLDALRENNGVTRRLRGIADVAALGVKAALEVERHTRLAERDWLRRPRLELHYDAITVRGGTAARTFQQICVHQRRGEPGTLRALAQAFEHDVGLRPLASDRLERAELLLKWMPSSGGHPDLPRTDTADEEIHVPDSEFLDPELSFLASQERVVAMAEDPATPLAERLRFLAIVASNLDEFFTIRVAGLAAASAEMLEESAASRRRRSDHLGAIREAARALAHRQSRALADCERLMRGAGVRLCTWRELDEPARAELRDVFRTDVLPELTPLAMTLSPGHPFPRLPHLSLSIATVLLDPDGGAPHFAEVEIPDSLAPFLQLEPAGGMRTLVPVEEVIRANLDALYPALRVEQAYLFRVTRGGDLTLDEAHADDLLDAVEDATRRRGGTAVVRVEVERAMPPVLRDLVLEELRGEGGGSASMLTADDLYEVDGLPDLRRLRAIELPDDPALRFEAFVPRTPLSGAPSLFDEIAARDLLVHHPFESFAGTVVRFLEEAAADPDVVVIRMTLYRAGDHSPIVDALRTAARQGKQVHAFVELRARFDEERNVKWVRALEKAGVHVVYGLRGLKTHAKAALVVRREGTRRRRYAHVGTGNYNVQTGLAYTDLSLFSARESLTADVADLFNALTGSSLPPAQMSRGVLVAPTQLLPALLELIEREAAVARSGGEAHIRIKLNGLSDPEIVRALVRASQDGVHVDLVVRGMCTLRPGVPGSSDRIRVVATAGRFLEHSRIYHFANAPEGGYYIGSADLRPRNLRRRVELLAPVADPAARETLDGLLTAYLTDPAGWQLDCTGTYVRRHWPGPGTQTALLRGAAGAPES